MEILKVLLSNGRELSVGDKVRVNLEISPNQFSKEKVTVEDLNVSNGEFWFTNDGCDFKEEDIIWKLDYNDWKNEIKNLMIHNQIALNELSALQLLEMNEKFFSECFQTYEKDQHDGHSPLSVLDDYLDNSSRKLKPLNE